MAQHVVEGLLGHLIGLLELSHDLLHFHRVWSALTLQPQHVHLKQVARDYAEIKSNSVKNIQYSRLMFDLPPPEKIQASSQKKDF